jgi:dsDNA-specific endonuclease/ATPase MutS2
MEIIHGIGEGVLKNEVHAILRDYNLRFYLTKDGGVTEVYI